MKIFRLALCAFVSVIGAAAPDADVEEAYRDGMNAAHAERWQDARRAFLDGRQQAPLDKRFPLELAGVAYKFGDRKEAIAQFRVALSLDPSDSYANDALGSLYLLEGNLEAALVPWNRVGKPVIRQIVFHAGALSDKAFLRRTVATQPGQVLERKGFYETLANLRRVGLSSVRLELAPCEDDRFDLLVTGAPPDPKSPSTWVPPLLSGLPYQTLNFAVQPSGAGLREFGGAVRWDPEKELVSLYAHGLLEENPRWAYSALIQGRDENWEIRQSASVAHGLPEFNLSKFEAKVQLEHGATSRLQWSNGISLSTRKYDQAAPSTPAFTDGAGLSLQSSLVYDVLRLPEQRMSMVVDGTSDFGRFFSLNEPFAKFQGGVRFQWTPGENRKAVELNASLRAGATVGQTPFDEYFTLGMERDNDLWLRGHVGTHDGRKGNSPIGRDYVLTQLDAMKTVYSGHFLRWQIGPFTDTGRVGGVFGSNGWLVDAGLESRLRIRNQLTLRVISGQDLMHGGTVFYTAVTR